MQLLESAFIVQSFLLEGQIGHTAALPGLLADTKKLKENIIMAAAGQSEDDDLVEEYIVDEELVKLLKSFELSATGIEEFVGMHKTRTFLLKVLLKVIELLFQPTDTIFRR